MFNSPIYICRDEYCIPRELIIIHINVSLIQNTTNVFCQIKNEALPCLSS